MQGVYKLTNTVASVLAAKTLAYITTHATKPIEIYRVSITAQNEDTAEQIFAEFNRISSLGTPTATTVTPKPTEESSSAYGGVAKTNVTASEPTYDAITEAIAIGGCNKLGGWEYVPLPEERPIVAANDNVGIRLIDALSATTNLTVEIVFREIG